MVLCAFETKSQDSRAGEVVLERGHGLLGVAAHLARHARESLAVNTQLRTQVVEQESVPCRNTYGESSPVGIFYRQKDPLVVLHQSVSRHAGAPRHSRREPEEHRPMHDGHRHHENHLACGSITTAHGTFVCGFSPNERSSTQRPLVTDCRTTGRRRPRSSLPTLRRRRSSG